MLVDLLYAKEYPYHYSSHSPGVNGVSYTQRPHPQAWQVTADLSARDEINDGLRIARSHHCLSLQLDITMS